jgi:predicted PurR-regulated permease PerM
VVTVPTRDQSVEFFQVAEGALVKYLEPRLLRCKIKGALGWAVAYFTFSSYALPIGLLVGVMEIVSVLKAFLGAAPAVLMVLFSGGLEGDNLVVLFLITHAVVRRRRFGVEDYG